MMNDVVPLFITLLPKTNDTNNFNDYHHISFIRCMWNFISEILAKRLKKMIMHMVRSVQIPFDDFFASKRLAERVAFLVALYCGIIYIN